MGAVHVADEMTLGTTREAPQRFRSHGWPEVRTPNANVDHVCHLALGMQSVHLVHEVKHAPADLENLGQDILSIHLKTIAIFSAQGHVKHGPAFCGVQFDTSKQVGDGARQIRFFAQGDQRVFHLRIPPLLGRIDVQPIQIPGQGLHT